MATQHFKRKLTAILGADVKGYGRPNTSPLGTFEIFTLRKRKGK